MFPAPAVCSLGIVNAILGQTIEANALPFVLLILTLSSCNIALVYALYFRYRYDDFSKAIKNFCLEQLTISLRIYFLKNIFSRA